MYLKIYNAPETHVPILLTGEPS